VSRLFRDAVLDLARRHPFARKLVNSGRLSLPAVLRDSPLNTPDAPGAFDPHSGVAPGAAAVDAPVQGPRDGWLLDYLGGRFVLVVFGDIPGAAVAALARASVTCDVVTVDGASSATGLALRDPEGLAARRYDARPGTCYLVRPDQHVCARWRRLDVGAVTAALARATCND
jgi:3-(3-hydroxy-phenyl)propionate hydroxylase